MSIQGSEKSIYFGMQFEKTLYSGLINLTTIMIGNCTKVRHGHREGGRLGLVKNFKTPFLKDIENSFLQVTHIGLEPHQFFSF